MSVGNDQVVDLCPKCEAELTEANGRVCPRCGHDQSRWSAGDLLLAIVVTAVVGFLAFGLWLGTALAENCEGSGSLVCSDFLGDLAPVVLVVAVVVLGALIAATIGRLGRSVR